MALQLRCLWGGLTVQHNKLIARLHWQSGQHSEVLQYCQRAGSYADVAAHLTRQLALSQQQAERRSALHGSDGLRLQVRHCLSHVFSVPFFAKTGPFLVALQLQFAEVLSAAGQFAPARDCLTGCLQAEEHADQSVGELRGRILLAVAINEVR